MSRHFPERILEFGRWLCVGGFAIGTFFWIPAVAFYRQAAVAPGRVTELLPELMTGADDDGPLRTTPLELHAHSQRGTVVHRLRVTFQDAQNQTHTVDSFGASSPPAHRVGDAVQVRYRPDRPDEAKIDEFDSLWGLPVLIQGISLGFFVIDSVVLRALRRGRSHPGSAARAPEIRIGSAASNDE